MPVLLDFESRSDADLRAIGGRLYWEHASSEALCCVAFDTDDGVLLVWEPGRPGADDVRVQIAARARAHTWAAHNATGFDRFAVRKYFDVDRTDWIDTSELARRAGLPGALDALGSRWLGMPKDKVASAYTKSLSRRSKAQDADGGWLYTPDLSRVVAYCVSDVEIMAEGWARLAPWLPLPGDPEHDVLRVDRTVNERGIGFDVQLAKRLLEIDAELCGRALEAAALKCGGTADDVRKWARSPQIFTELTGLPNAQKQTVDTAIATHLDQEGRALPPATIALCEARRALASIARGKLEAGLLRVSADGRLRDNLRYYGAHTGRWSGRGVQLQNLPRPEKRFEEWIDEDICRLADHVLGGGTLDTPGEVDLLLRACLVPRPGHRLIARDFAAIEARALAWCANDVDALQAFADKRDLYKVAAATIYGALYDEVTKAQRQIGKVAELALGYQGGTAALERMAKAYGVDLHAPGMPVPEAIVKGWRSGRRAVVDLWYQADAAFRTAAQGEGEDLVGYCKIAPRPDADVVTVDGAGVERRDRGVAITLPSGRAIIYNGTALTPTTEGRRSHRLTYLGTKGTEHAYGGKLIENMIQGLCRDIMAAALVAAEDCRAPAMPVALTIHDEVVSEVLARDVPAAVRALDEIMHRVPEWARGMPINASGFEANRYRK